MSEGGWFPQEKFPVGISSDVDREEAGHVTIKNAVLRKQNIAVNREKLRRNLSEIQEKNVVTRVIGSTANSG
jgi:hypothetical protein